MRTIEDLTGQKFGKLTVIKLSGIRRGHRYWICKCDCSKTSDVRGSHLRARTIKSCGCSQIDDISGQIFYYLTAIRYLETRNTNAYWLCECFCGNTTEVAMNNLKRGEVKSCGCMACELSKNTSVKNWGKENPTQADKIKEKIRNSNIAKYGVPCTLQVLEINKKAKETIMARYGVEHVMQNPDIALKAAKSSNNSYILKHWLSNENIVCVASYEKMVISYLNKNYIDYNWQPQVFTMLDGRTYRPDLYLPDEDKWIEIKGYFRDDAEEKWEWFHKEYPNSELWDKKKLKEAGIL